MAVWKQYAMSVILCALCCGILMNLITDARRKRIIQSICGTVLAISVLSPLSNIQIDRFLRQNITAADSAERFISIGKQSAIEARHQYIKDTCEAYISNRASAMDTALSVYISLDENMIPAFAQLHGDYTHNAQQELESILETELGITKENQVWIWNQKSNSS